MISKRKSIKKLYECILPQIFNAMSLDHLRLFFMTCFAITLQHYTAVKTSVANSLEALQGTVAVSRVSGAPVNALRTSLQPLGGNCLSSSSATRLGSHMAKCVGKPKNKARSQGLMAHLIYLICQICQRV